MEYLHVLSRPKVIDQEHDTVWTEAYIDSTVSWLRHLSHGAGLQFLQYYTRWPYTPTGFVYSMGPEYSVIDL